MIDETQRTALFISHATPEDNDFVRWLGAKLTALGYEVWADVMRLRGGCDWSRELEEALRHRTAKVLVVCTPTGLDKDGVRSEIEIASGLRKQLGDRDFIIPLRLESYEAPIRIAQAQYVDFKGAWARGFAELADLLSQFPSLRKEPGRSTEAWLWAQRDGATRLVERRERLTSNWLTLRSLPEMLRYCEPPTGYQTERFQHRNLHPWPVVPFRSGVLTFASPDSEGMLGQEILARVITETKTESFLDHGWEQLGIAWHEAQKIFADLANQALEKMFHEKGLSFSEGSSGRRWWYGNVKTTPLSQIGFDWRHQKGRRQIVGKSDKRAVFWHYAVSGQIRTTPVRHARISASLIFSDNGMDALKDTRKAHRLRRSFAKTWRNARWRDMMLAFLWWTADGKDALAVPVANGRTIVLSLPPASFSSPVSVLHDGEDPPDEDDPDVDDSEWDEQYDFDEEAER